MIGEKTYCQGYKISVAVKIDSVYESFYLRNLLCDTFICIFQDDKFLFYEKSLRLAKFDLYTGEILNTVHLPPNKILVGKGKMIFHSIFNSKMVSTETSAAFSSKIPLKLFNTLRFEQFVFTDETKNVGGVLCQKGSSPGPEGDTVIIWMVKDSVSNHTRSIFNLYFTKPPVVPIMEFTMRNFRKGEAIINELSYAIFAFEKGDFSKEFQELKNYMRVTEAEYMIEYNEAMKAVQEKEEKGKN